MKPINMILSLFYKKSQVGHMAAETKGKRKVHHLFFIAHTAPQEVVNNRPTKC